MKYDPDILHRRSIRLRGYDYAVDGAYFVTICAPGRESLFGDIENDGMMLNEAGRMVEHWWAKLPDKFPGIVIDEYMIMPNHFHGIICIVGADPCVRPGFRSSTSNAGRHMGLPLHGMVQWFKTMTTNAYIRGVNEQNWPPFSGRFWQRNYYERIIRDEKELTAIREYIINNPARWAEDKENPDFT